jgi:hypothetical protein
LKKKASLVLKSPIWIGERKEEAIFKLQLKGTSIYTEPFSGKNSHVLLKRVFIPDLTFFLFPSRIQRLNELEAHTRIKLNFLDQVAKFWELQGTTLKIPLVERRALDLFTLKKYVCQEGGMEKVNADKKWTKVATDMGFAVTTNKNVGAVLKAHYERIIFPLEVFEREERKKAKVQLMQRQQRRMQQLERGEGEKQEIVSALKKYYN